MKYGENFFPTNRACYFTLKAVISIAIGASLGALLRWVMGNCLNYLFPVIPLGTLVANLFGGGLMGVMIFLTTEHAFFSYEIRLGIITGFLGGLTTFSTFSAEALSLFAKGEFFWFSTLLLLHVFGSIGMVAAGYALTKFISHF